MVQVQFRFLVEFLSIPRYILNHLISPTQTLIETTATYSY